MRRGVRGFIDVNYTIGNVRLGVAVFWRASGGDGDIMTVTDLH